MRNFLVTDEDMEKLQKWHKEDPKHKECFEKPKGAIGGHLVYSFCPTSIGTGLIVRCSICKSEIDLTDYDSW